MQCFFIIISFVNGVPHEEDNKGKSEVISVALGSQTGAVLDVATVCSSNCTKVVAVLLSALYL